MSFRMSHRSERWYASSSPNDQSFKAKINPVKRSTGGFHWPRVEMQYLIKTTLYCVTITIQTSCFAGVVSIDSGLELIYQFVSCLQVKEQRNRRLEERKGEISLIGSAAVLLNTEIEGSMCFVFAYIDFLPSFYSLLDKHKHVHSFFALLEQLYFIFRGWEGSLIPDNCHLINHSNQWKLLGWICAVSYYVHANTCYPS